MSTRAQRRGRGEAVTSHDVARLAGVSQPTVSRALRDLSGASAATIARVKAAADTLGYVPSEAGRTLSTRRTFCIGIVAGELTNPFYPELIEPMRGELEKNGYRTLLIPDADESPLEIERLTDGSLDGVLLTTSTVASAIPSGLTDRGIPYVLVNRTVDGVESDQCTFDNSSGASAAARYLVNQGHSRIALVGGPRETSTGRERMVAFEASLRELGVYLDPALVSRGPFSFATGYQSTKDLLRRAEPPTAIFCGNDVIALGALNALGRERSDVTVVGFDDIAMTRWDRFRITTVRGDLGEMARQSVRLLLRRIDDPDAAFERIVIPTALVERE